MQQLHRQASGRQGTGRATLTPQERTKRGKTYWCARGQIPFRKTDGSVGSRRIERGFGADVTTETQRQKKCAEWNVEYEERFRNPRKLITFAKAYTNYLGKGHEIPWKGVKILKLIGMEQCSDIDDTMMDELTDELWPEGAMPGTVNRHLYSPVLAILHQALKEKAPQLQRPKGHGEVKPVTIPPEGWYRAVAPECNPSQLAFVMLLAMHGRRTREMLGRKPDHLDIKAGLLDLGNTKTGIRELVIHPNACRCSRPSPTGATANGYSAPARTAPIRSGGISRGRSCASGSAGITRTASAGICPSRACCAPATASLTSPTPTA